MEIKEVKVKSFGEILIGVDYAQPQETEVYIVKKQFAELADKLKDNYNENRSPTKSLLFDHAIGELVNAQMAIVKVLTFKTEE